MKKFCWCGGQKKLVAHNDYWDKWVCVYCGAEEPHPQRHLIPTHFQERQARMDLIMARRREGK